MAGMPQSAAATGLVDYVLPVEEMPAKLIEYRDHLRASPTARTADGTRTDAASTWRPCWPSCAPKPVTTSRKYKSKTVTRRIQRRMQVLQADTVAAYIHICATTRPRPKRCSATCSSA